MTLPPGFMKHVRKSTNGCWHWTGGLSRGYGHLNYRVNGRCTSIPAHRRAYELTYGPLPRPGGPGFRQVDHECHNRSKSCKGGPTCLHRRCVNPAHLTAKTPKDNGASSPHTPASINRAKTHCLRGHPLSGDNLREHAGKRQCRACHLEKGSEARRRRVAAARPDGWMKIEANSKKTHCKHGHELTGSNLYIATNGTRKCRACQNAATIRWRKAKVR